MGFFFSHIEHILINLFILEAVVVLTFKRKMWPCQKEWLLRQECFSLSPCETIKA